MYLLVKIYSSFYFLHLKTWKEKDKIISQQICNSKMLHYNYYSPQNVVVFKKKTRRQWIKPKKQIPVITITITGLLDFVHHMVF
jgi:hypothetical protein